MILMNHYYLIILKNYYGKSTKVTSLATEALVRLGCEFEVNNIYLLFQIKMDNCDDSNSFQIKLEPAEVIIKEEVMEECSPFEIIKCETNPPPANTQIKVEQTHEEEESSMPDFHPDSFKFKVFTQCIPSSSHKNHMLHHMNTKRKCGEPAKCLGRNKDLKLHKRIEADEKPSKCPTCQKCFTRSSNLKKHLLIHEGAKPFRCEWCDKCFTHASNLKKHLLIHEGTKPFKCERCGKRFTQNGNLKKHMLFHEGKKPFNCQRCDKSFVLNSHLKQHVLIHEGKKLFKCERCDKSFTLNGDLKRHILIHDGKKPFKCPHCGNGFTQNYNLKRHILIHEGKSPLQRLTSICVSHKNF